MDTRSLLCSSRGTTFPIPPKGTVDWDERGESQRSGLLYRQATISGDIAKVIEVGFVPQPSLPYFRHGALGG